MKIDVEKDMKFDISLRFKGLSSKDLQDFYNQIEKAFETSEKKGFNYLEWIRDKLEFGIKKDDIKLFTDVNQEKEYKGDFNVF